jgi:hypothetical protein
MRWGCLSRPCVVVLAGVTAHCLLMSSRWERLPFAAIDRMDGLTVISRRYKKLIAGIGAFLLAYCCGLCHAQKTDTITMINGDVLTGDLKELYRGLLKYSTDSMGTIYIEWLDIAAIESNKNFIVETASGIRAFGMLSTSDDGEGINVSYADRSLRLDKYAVVVITRIKDTFLSRLSGTLGAGFNFKKANSDLQLFLNSDVKYVTRRHSYDFSLSAQVSSRSDRTSTERYVGNFVHRGYVRPKWSSLAGAEFEQNTELDLRLRTLAQGGGVRGFINSNRNRLDTAAGLALNDERYFEGGQADKTSMELFAFVGYEFFKFNTPKADVVLGFSVFPSLTEKGRVRTSAKVKIRWEIVGDLFWSITYYSSTDNQPPMTVSDGDTEPADGIDYGINLALDWSFN